MSTGFTGVVWEARPAERLAQDIGAGLGSVPMAEAGEAWTRIAGTFGAAAQELPHIVAGLQEAWRSAGADALGPQVGKIQRWLADTADAATHHASQAKTQADAHQEAKLAMPSVPDLAAARTMMQAAQLGAPLFAMSAAADTAHAEATATAARVMHTYEAATAPMVNPAHSGGPIGTPMPPTAFAGAQDRAESFHTSIGTADWDLDTPLTGAPAVLGAVTEAGGR